MQFSEERLNEVFELVHDCRNINVHEMAQILNENETDVVSMLKELERRDDVVKIASDLWVPLKRRESKSSHNQCKETPSAFKHKPITYDRRHVVTKFKWLSEQLDSYRCLVFSSKNHKSSSLISAHLLDQELNDGKNVIIFDVDQNLDQLNKEVFDNEIDLAKANIIKKEFSTVDEFAKELECLIKKPDIIYINRIEEVFKTANACLLGAFLYNYAYENDVKIVISGLLITKDDGFLLPKYCDYSQYRCMDLLSHDSDILIDCYD